MVLVQMVHDVRVDGLVLPVSMGCVNKPTITGFDFRISISKMKTLDVIIVTMVSWALLVPCTSAQGTSNGLEWFGLQGQYKCRCTDNRCDENGTCTDGARCQGGWFGPACQYADLAYNRLPTLTDGNDTTCITSTSSGSVTVTLDNSYWFTWLRVHLNNPGFLHRLTVHFDSNTSCPNSRISTVDNTTLDIYCDLNEKIQSVTLTVDGIEHLCSIYVNGGRNVALKQSTTQSSNYSENSTSTGNVFKYFPSTYAVDGNTSGNFYKDNTCTHTQAYSASNPTWSVTFSNLQNVTRFLVYNREDGVNNIRLKGFTLESFNQSSNPVFSYRDLNTTAQSVYKVTPGLLTSPISRVTITAYQSEKILTLCEVEVYGDSSCDSRHYGRECEGTCNCAGGEACFVSTGRCPSGCAAGFYGDDCSIPCETGKYGPGCNSPCSQSCVGSNGTLGSYCSPVNGTCTYGCESGYEELTCTKECAPGKYGPGCRSTCSQSCKSGSPDGRSCDHRNGTCLSGCEDGYRGLTCNAKCDLGTYGKGCSFTCSQFCTRMNDTNVTPCDHVNGTCYLGCLSGYTPPLCAEAIKQGGGDDDDDVIIGAVVGVVAGVILLALVVVAVIFWRRHRARKPKQGSASEINGRDAVNLNEIRSQASDAGSTVKEPKANSAVKINGNDRTKTGEHGMYYNTVSGESSTVISLNDLPGFMKSKDRTFFENQFSTIPLNKSATVAVGTNSENKHKNRYKNIAAYDHSRVNLIPNVDKRHGDYINASYVEGYKNDEKFIAAQGPTKIMLEDFVRMLWEQKVEKVVMLTNLIENGKQKCERYWPEEGEMKIGEITVKLTTTQVFADYTIRRLQLKESEQVQNVTHFHFTAWPDKDVPTGPWSLVDFEQRVASYPTDRPIVVHCSAGVGRTGTFIALRNVMRQAEETGKVDFFTTVQKLRQDRINMVQTVDQYIFLHTAAQVAMVCIGTTVALTDAKMRIQILETKSKSGQTKMEEEFQSISSLCDEKMEIKTSEENPYNVYENSQSIVNRQKNRVSTILPKDNFRAKLSNNSSDLTDYINAVLVPSFNKQNQHILTQLPLPTTITDFWRLVTQYNVTLVVAFELNSKSTDQTIGDYLPSSENELATFSTFHIQTEPVTAATFWKQQKILVTVEGNQVQKKEHRLTHITCTTTDLDPGHLLPITEQIRSLNSSAGERRTLYMCRNGAEYSGLVCVLSLLLNRMDNDHHLTVPLVVGAIKAIRPQVIPTLNQYRALYQVLQLYSESINEYSNIGDSAS